MSVHPRVDHLIRTGNGSEFGVGGTVYAPEFSDFAGIRATVARMYRENTGDQMRLLRWIRRNRRDYPLHERPYGVDGRPMSWPRYRVLLSRDERRNVKDEGQ